MHQSPCPHSACCENPDGPYEEWVHCATAYNGGCRENCYSSAARSIGKCCVRVTVTTHGRVFPYITRFSQRFRPVPLEATKSLVPLWSTSSPLTPRFGPNSPQARLLVKEGLCL